MADDGLQGLFGMGSSRFSTLWDEDEDDKLDDKKGRKDSRWQYNINVGIPEISDVWIVD